MWQDESLLVLPHLPKSCFMCREIFIISVLVFHSVFLPSSSNDQQNTFKTNKLEVLGTRSWIKIQWKEQEKDEGYRLYWSVDNKQPELPQVTLPKGSEEYYITNVSPGTQYFIWLEPVNSFSVQQPILSSVFTRLNWELCGSDTTNLYPPTTGALPEGMVLFWCDEFNDKYLNRNKWSTNYYSTIDYKTKVNFEFLNTDNLPQPYYILNGRTLKLITCESLPLEPYFSSGRKISSIQTYDWNSNELLLDNSLGGYFEIRVRRIASRDAELVNTAFWFDSPGPDLKYYMEKGTTAGDVEGIRPSGQPFEIDVFEYLNTEIVLHGDVSKNGNFLGNIGHQIIRDTTNSSRWTTHGVLWTPSELKFYLDGDLVAQWIDRNDMKSPNHMMNVLIGAYGKGGYVAIEVDYIRYYRWRLNENNKLPNGGFEYSSKDFFPWGGTGVLSSRVKRQGNYGLELNPGEYIEQYVFLKHSSDYALRYWTVGKGALDVRAENLLHVTGDVKSSFHVESTSTDTFRLNELEFRTGDEFGDHLSRVKISFTNNSTSSIHLDDLQIKNLQREK